MLKQDQTTPSFQYDKHGVPIYSGELHLLEEYNERAWDLFHGRTGQDSLQTATPLHLRSGCRGVVYEAVKSLPHADLLTRNDGTDDDTSPTEAGMKIFLAAVRAALGKETSIEETEEFDRCFYDDRIHRQHGESMAAYIIRRNADFERLNRVVEGGCAIPEKFQTHVQVK